MMTIERGMSLDPSSEFKTPPPVCALPLILCVCELIRMPRSARPQYPRPPRAHQCAPPRRLSLQRPARLHKPSPSAASSPRTPQPTPSATPLRWASLCSDRCSTSRCALMGQLVAGPSHHPRFHFRQGLARRPQHSHYRHGKRRLMRPVCRLEVFLFRLTATRTFVHLNPSIGAAKQALSDHLPAIHKFAKTLNANTSAVRSSV